MLDEVDTERTGTIKTLPYELPIPWLENVERYPYCWEKNQIEWEESERHSQKDTDAERVARHPCVK